MVCCGAFHTVDELRCLKRWGNMQTKSLFPGNLLFPTYSDIITLDSSRTVIWRELSKPTSICAIGALAVQPAMPMGSKDRVLTREGSQAYIRTAKINTNAGISSLQVCGRRIWSIFASSGSWYTVYYGVTQSHKATPSRRRICRKPVKTEQRQGTEHLATLLLRGTFCFLQHSKTENYCLDRLRDSLINFRAL